VPVGNSFNPSNSISTTSNIPLDKKKVEIKKPQVTVPIKSVEVGKSFNPSNTTSTTSNIPAEKPKITNPITRHEAVNYIEKKYQPTFVKIPEGLGDNSNITISKPFSEKLVPALQSLNKEIKENGYEVKIHQGSRSLAEQAAHLKSGASTIPVSLHNVGEAVDISFWKDGKKVMIDSLDKQYKETKEMLETIGSKLENLGFVWGGRWSNPYDPWHVQYHSNTKNYLENNKDMIPKFKAFLPDYKEKLKTTKDSTDKKKLTDLIEYLENS